MITAVSIVRVCTYYRCFVHLISVEFSECNIELVDFRYLNSTQLSDDRLDWFRGLGVHMDTAILFTFAAAETAPEASWLVRQTQPQTFLGLTVNGFPKSRMFANTNMFQLFDSEITPVFAVSWKRYEMCIFTLVNYSNLACPLLNHRWPWVTSQDHFSEFEAVNGQNQQK